MAGWVWLLFVVATAPWIAAIAWVCWRTPPSDDLPPSMAQRFLTR